MDELWKPVPAAEFSSRYEVSDLGRVRNIKTGHVLKPMRVGRRRDGKSRAAASRSTVRFSTVPLRDFHVAQLVLEAFIGARPIAHVIMHLDDNTDNNALSNLRWGTARENVHDMVRKGRCGGQVLTLEQVGQIIRRRSAGERGRALAIEFGISEQRICDLYKGRTILGGGY